MSNVKSTIAFICIHVCQVCKVGSLRGRDGWMGERDIEIEIERERMRVCVCVCVCRKLSNNIHRCSYCSISPFIRHE